MKNQVKISGKRISNLEFSYAAWNQKFYFFQIAVERKSKKVDCIWVMLPDNLIVFLPKVGEYATVKGSLRSSKRTAHGRYLFANEITKEEVEKNENKVSVHGIVVSDPHYGQKKDGREITTVIIACNRRNGNPAYIPIVAWGRNAAILKKSQRGDMVGGIGRYLERPYLKDGMLFTTYEASLDVVRIERSNNHGC